MKKAVVAGAGPAGLTCATYLAQAGWQVDVFSGEEMYISCLALAPNVRNYPGFPEGIAGLDLLGRFIEQAERSGVQIHSEAIASIDTNGKMAVDSNNVAHPYDEFVMASGVKSKEFTCAGIDKIPVHTCAVCDGGLYGKNDTVVVIGGGDTAISSALYLSGIVGRVYVLVRKGYLRATNKSAVDELENQDNVEIEYETELERVSTDTDGNPILHIKKKGMPSEITGVKSLFTCIGYDVNEITRMGDGVVWKCGDCVEIHHQVAVAVGSGARVALEILKG